MRTVTRKIRLAEGSKVSITARPETAERVIREMQAQALEAVEIEKKLRKEFGIKGGDINDNTIQDQVDYKVQKTK